MTASPQAAIMKERSRQSEGKKSPDGNLAADGYLFHHRDLSAYVQQLQLKFSNDTPLSVVQNRMSKQETARTQHQLMLPMCAKCCVTAETY